MTVCAKIHIITVCAKIHISIHISYVIALVYILVWLNWEYKLRFLPKGIAAGRSEMHSISNCTLQCDSNLAVIF